MIYHVIMKRSLNFRVACLVLCITHVRRNAGGSQGCQIGPDFPAQSGNPACIALQPGLPDCQGR